MQVGLQNICRFDNFYEVCSCHFFDPNCKLQKFAGLTGFGEFSRVALTNGGPFDAKTFDRKKEEDKDEAFSKHEKLQCST
jgi:hypothetical protein